MRAARLFVLLAAGALAAGCARQTRPTEENLPPRVTLEEATALVPKHVEDREGWALDILTALNEHRLHPDLKAVCSVLAVIEQESGYKANPPVENLAKIVGQRLDEYAKNLGPVGDAFVEKMLEGKAKGSKHTFKQRLQKVKTERDLDLVFRDMVAFYEEEYSVTYALVDFASEVSGRGGIEALNPITTAGSMQVSVRFALDVSEDDGLHEWEVRDKLYTRAGGVSYGSLRLLGYPAGYDAPIYRFADFNAGFYASRNAAFQAQLNTLTGHKLVTDGDLLAYDKEGEPLDQDTQTLAALFAFSRKYAPDLSESEIRKDARKEKSRAFEETDTWRAVRLAYRAKTGEEPAYARVPDVAIRSPKMKKERSTAWFAKNVNLRYEACLKRAP